MRDKRIQHILDTSLELFANKGYHRTSISTIASEAGISKGLLYNYFSSKEELVVELMKNGFEEVTRFFNIKKGDILSREEMKVLISNTLQSVQNKSHFWRLYFSVMSQPIVTHAAFAEIMEIAAPIFKILSDYFLEQSYQNPETEARFFTAILDGITMNYVYDPESFPIQQIENRLLSMYHLNS